MLPLGLSLCTSKKNLSLFFVFSGKAVVNNNKVYPEPFFLWNEQVLLPEAGSVMPGIHMLGFSGISACTGRPKRE